MKSSVTVAPDDVIGWAGEGLKFLFSLPANGPDVTMPVGTVMWAFGLGAVLGGHFHVHDVIADQIPWGGKKVRNAISTAWVLFIVGGIAGVVEVATR